MIIRQVCLRVRQRNNKTIVSSRFAVADALIKGGHGVQPPTSINFRGAGALVFQLGRDSKVPVMRQEEWSSQSTAISNVYLCLPQRGGPVRKPMSSFRY